MPVNGTTLARWVGWNPGGGTQPTGWEEPLADISNTGLVVSQSTARDGYEHAVAWSREAGLVDLGTLAATGDPKYAIYKASYARGTSKLGTLIAGSGWSPEASKGWPAVWTPSFKWKDGKFVTKWKIQALDLSAYPELTGGLAWGVNDYGQIVGGGYNDDFTIFKALLWSPRAHGKGWEVNALPTSLGYPIAQAYSINDRGEIVGVSNSADFSIWLPRLWKPTDGKRTAYPEPIELPVPEAFTYCETVGINEVGDMVGDCWNDTEDLPTRWATKDLTFSEIINFPADWGFAWGVNNNRIATVTYTGGQKCSAGVPGVYTCGGAIQLH
jgi:probable HAF family extracellular repeat protein